MFRTTALVAVLLHFTFPAGAAEQTFIENFSSTQYKDTLNTTAWWDTIAGELKLYPFNPSSSDTVTTPGLAQAIVIDGTRAFIADGASGVLAFDVTDPSSLTPIGSYDTPGNALDVAVNGTHAFVADGLAGLQIVEIDGMAFVSSYNTPGLARGVTVSGNLCFVADGDSLQIIDISDPLSPSRVAGYYVGSLWDVSVDGDYAYIADGGGLLIVDITDPANPATLGSISLGGGVAVAVEGDFAYVATGSMGMAIVDISNPASPTQSGSYGTIDETLDVVVDGGFAYLADGPNGFRVLDVSNPAAPAVVHTYAAAGQVSGIAAEGTHAYLAAGTAGVEAVSVRSYQNPEVVGTFWDLSDFEQVEVSGDVAYVVGSSGLMTVDISNPATPVLLDTYSTAGVAFDVTTAGDYAYLAAGPQGLVVVDITDPAALSAVGSYFGFNSAVGIVVDGNYAYVADYLLYLRVVDITDPTNPVLADQYEFSPGTSPEDVAVVGDRALVALGALGFAVLDVSDPTSIGHVTDWSSGFDAATFITVHGHHAYVGGDFGGFNLVFGVDITDPDNPDFDIVTGVVMPYSGVPQDVAVSGNSAYIVGDVGLEIQEVANLGNLQGSLSVDGPATGIAMAGDDVYIAGGNGTGMVTAQAFNRDFVLSAISAQSAPIPMNALAFRLNPIQSGSIQWEVSDYFAWRPAIPGTWSPTTYNDTTRVWRATLGTPPAGGASPVCSQLQLDWLVAEPTIDSVEDIANDQGGWVRVNFTRSGGDVQGAPGKVTDYIVWRRSNASAASATSAAVQPVPGDPERDYVSDFPSLPLTRAGNRFIATSPAGFPPGNWEIVGSFPAFLEHNYSYVVPTLADSGSAGPAYSVHVITAHVGSAYYTSAPDSGASLDNIAPGVPQGVSVVYGAGSGNQLSWDAAAEPDFQYYRIYRGASPDFTPAPENLVHSTATTGWADPGFDDVTVSYKVTALDHAGNESDAGSHSPATGAQKPERLVQNALYPNVPNPFNPSTTIRYSLLEAGDVALVVYDAAGRRVRTLVDAAQPAGMHDVVWNGLDHNGTRVASGVYFYRLTAGDFTQTRKMVLLK